MKYSGVSREKGCNRGDRARLSGSQGAISIVVGATRNMHCKVGLIIHLINYWRKYERYLADTCVLLEANLSSRKQVSQSSL